MKVPPLESIFLNRKPRPEVRDVRRVLVVGGDNNGRELTEQLTHEGFEALLVDNTGGSELSAGAKCLPATTLEEIQGFVGGFEAALGSPSGRRTERVGLIVAAQPAQNIPKYAEYGIHPSERVISLSDLEIAVASGTTPTKPAGEWLHVVFLCGLAGESDPALFARVFEAIDSLRKTRVVQPYVFTRHVKVAAAGLERRYREIREGGTLFFKFDAGGPVLEQTPDGLTIIFTDPLLGLEMELVPDLLVVDECHRPHPSLKPFLDAIPSAAVTAPFLQPESTRFPGVKTPKVGILALGPARGIFGPDSTESDIAAAVVAARTLDLDENPPGLPGPPVIDPAKCTICLTCVRLCPHGAISFQKRAEADPVSCMRCGICAVECPMQAITLAPVTGESDIVGKITAGLAQTTDTGKIAAFLCRRSAARAMESAGVEIRKSLLPIVAPCAGTVDPVHILTAFLEGARGVLVAGCHTGNCASIYGTVLAAGRSEQTRLMLEEAGVDPGRFMFTTLASNTPGDFVRAVTKLERTIEGIASSEF